MKNIEECEPMTSNQISDLTSKQHDYVLRDIRSMLMVLGRESSSFESTYRDAYGCEQFCYNLNGELTITLLAKYDTELRNEIINRWLGLKEKSMAFYKGGKNELYNGGTVGYVEKRLSKKTTALSKRHQFFFDIAEVISASVQKKVDGTHWLVVGFNNGTTTWYDIDNDKSYGKECVAEIWNLKLEGS